MGADHENDETTHVSSRAPATRAGRCWRSGWSVASWLTELRADAFIPLALGPDGKAERAKLRAVLPETDVSFDFQDLLLRPVPSPERHHSLSM